MTDEPITFHHEWPGAVNRRHAMGLMAASLALATTGCSRPPREEIHPWARMPEARSAQLPVYYASACLRDGHGLGVLVGTRDGRPIKIEGNPAHPSSLGATDVFAQASVLELWDPDRSEAVMQRGAVSSWEAFETQWRAEAARLAARSGEGLAILTGPVGSPTLRAQLAALLARFPRARWYQHSALRDHAAETGAQAAFGQAVQTVLHLHRAKCAVALGSDPFSDGPGAVRYAMDWSRQRASGARAALFAAETSPGLFGARADRRIALAPGEIDAMLARVHSALSGSASVPAPDAAVRPFESDLVAALRSAGPDALLVPGTTLSAASHARVHAIHERLGCMGRTIDLIAPLAWAGEASGIAELVRALDGGAVDTLVILDANPAYDAPGALGFMAALAKARFAVHAGQYRDETAVACAWHLPLSHMYEQWSDAPAHDGTMALVQPAIAPLYDTRSAHEIVALLAGDDVRGGMQIVQRQWKTHAGNDFDGFWRESLRQGVIAGRAGTPLQLHAGGTLPPAEPQAPVPGSGEVIVEFRADPSTHDGRFANNAWLQELPRPFTKHTWGNALMLGPATARAFGLATGDKVRIARAGAQVDAPVWVHAQHAENVATLPLGYGRRNAGRVGNGVGFDANLLRPVQGTLATVRLARLAVRHEFAVTQHAMEQEGRELARTMPPGARAEHATEARLPTLYPAHEKGEHAWGMTIDLDACIGCNACTIACQAENNIPVVGAEQVSRGREMHWIRVDRYESREVPGSLFQPVPCMHCENAPCELVCPVGATMHDSEGLNVQVYNRCIGTRFCSNNCPYKVRRFNFLQFTDTRTESLKGQRNPEVTVRQRGVMEKCTYCLQRVARARQQSQVTGVALKDGDVVTACQAVCPTTAIHFGDLADPHSELVHARESPRHYALLAELGTRPRTTYLARLAPARQGD
jgi:molybdopterin-containing oxidoreductase family iron-sulfur binding subunit